MTRYEKFINRVINNHERIKIYNNFKTNVNLNHLTDYNNFKFYYLSLFTLYKREYPWKFNWCNINHDEEIIIFPFIFYKGIHKLNKINDIINTLASYSSYSNFYYYNCVDNNKKYYVNSLGIYEDNFKPLLFITKEEINEHFLLNDSEISLYFNFYIDYNLILSDKDNPVYKEILKLYKQLKKTNNKQIRIIEHIPNTFGFFKSEDNFESNNINNINNPNDYIKLVNMLTTNMQYLYESSENYQPPF